jgi:hypothetical protein
MNSKILFGVVVLFGLILKSECATWAPPCGIVVSCGGMNVLGWSMPLNPPLNGQNMTPPFIVANPFATNLAALAQFFNNQNLFGFAQCFLSQLNSTCLAGYNMTMAQLQSVTTTLPYTTVSLSISTTTMNIPSNLSANATLALLASQPPANLAGMPSSQVTTLLNNGQIQGSVPNAGLSQSSAVALASAIPVGTSLSQVPGLIGCNLNPQIIQAAPASTVESALTSAPSLAAANLGTIVNIASRLWTDVSTTSCALQCSIPQLGMVACPNCSSLLPQLNVPVNQIPMQLIMTYTTQLRAGTTLPALLANTSVSQFNKCSLIKGLVPGDLTSLPKGQQFPVCLNIIQLSVNCSVQFTSNQRKLLFGCVVSDMSKSMSLPNTLAAFLNLTVQQQQLMFTVLIEAVSPSDMSALYNSPAWNNFMPMYRTFTQAQCCSFSRQSRAMVAMYGEMFLQANRTVNKTNVMPSDLDVLGPCFASVLPANFMSMLAPMDFISRIQYFLGPTFQANSNVLQIISAYLTTLIGSASFPTADSLTMVASELAVLLPANVIATMNQTNLISNINNFLNNLLSSKNVMNPQVQQCGVGVTDNSFLNTAINNFQNFASTTIRNYKNNNNQVAGRRRRQVTTSAPYTCVDLTNYQSILTQLLGTADIQAITGSNLYLCLSLIGSITTWSSTQLITWVNTILSSVYSNIITNIPDSDLTKWGYLLNGLTATQLGSLNIQTWTSVGTLGLNNGYTVTQITSAVALIRSATPLGPVNGAWTSSMIIAMGSLNCGISQADITAMTTAVITPSLPTLSQISEPNCQSMMYWYSVVYVALQCGPVTSPSQSTLGASCVSQMGSVIGGIGASDLIGLSADVIPSITTSALLIMSAAQINLMSPVQIAALTTAQAVTLLTSAVFASLTTTIQQEIYANLGLTWTTTVSSASTVKSALIFPAAVLAFVMNKLMKY